MKDESLSADAKAAQDAMQAAFEEPAPQAPKPASAAVEEKPVAAEATLAAEEKPEATPAWAITREEWDATKTELAALKAERSKLNGTVGNLQQLVTQLRSATPQGVQIELPPELEQDFPELAAHLKKAKIRGTATAPASDAKPSTGDEEIKRLISEATENAHKDVDARLRSARQQVEAEALEDLHPDWREVTGASATPDQNQPFRKWLASQPEKYQSLVNETDSASVIARAIDRFKADAAKAKPAKDKAPPSADKRRAAIQPKGDGGQPAPNPNQAEALLLAGFES